MYSRATSPKDRNRPLHLPEHYSGNAFTDRTPERDEHSEPLRPLRVPEPARPTPLPSLPPPKDIPKPHLQNILGIHLPFANGFGSDELFLVGLILLLSRDAETSDAVLLLSLLLFCG